MSQAASGPIGVFDSGVGGLSVLREVRELLPGEDLLYVADQAHCPYGSKSREQIAERARAITQFLVKQGAKLIVVACNTATTAAVDELRATFRQPIVGMEPAVKPAAAATRNGMVGVLATGATLSGDRFARLVERFGEGLQVLTQPCPGLVEQVEAGDLTSHHTRDLVNHYVEHLLAAGADTLVLGCTHYPFLRELIAAAAGPEVTLIDTGPAVARQVARVLDANGLRRLSEQPGTTRLFTTGQATTEVESVMQRLMGGPATLSVMRV
jgi:glutamate racemase